VAGEVRRGDVGVVAIEEVAEEVAVHDRVLGPPG
jgi:hypothetical protein